MVNQTDSSSSSSSSVIISLPDKSNAIPLNVLQELYLCGLGEQQTIKVANLSLSERKNILITGGAGFVGSHLVDRLMLLGHQVTVIDNLSTGSINNIQHWLNHPNFKFMNQNVQEPVIVSCDQIYHLACPASPIHYQSDPIQTIHTSVLGTMNMLELAKQVNAKILLASTSEVYGDPKVHPQTEDYLGNVNTIGMRACYDEGKRCAETLLCCYERQHGVKIRIARIFNTYGPRMDEYDGRVVSNFVTQALRGEDLTIYGDGKQTRSFQFVLDLVTGLITLMESDYSMPVNLGNPEEYEINEFALIIKELLNSSSKIVHLAEAPDDPQQRKPEISRAKKVLDWSPKYKLRDGLVDTVQYFKQTLAR